MTHEQMKCLMVAQMVGPTLIQITMDYDVKEGCTLADVVTEESIKTFEAVADKIISNIYKKEEA